jgi:hypothetical protein
MKKTAGAPIQYLLSFIIVFHFCAVMIAPNFESFLGSKTAFVTQPYLNFFGLMSNWGFFAPDPGPPPIHIEYAALDKVGHTIETGTWPPLAESLVFREQQNRRITAARFMFMSDTRTEKMMVPYVCNNVPGTWSVQLWKTVKYQPTFADITQVATPHTTPLGRQMERQWVADSFCEPKAT